MSNYTVTTNFGAKDSLPSGNAAKVIKGSEFTTEFTNIQTAIATKADTAGDTFTGVVNFSADVAVNTNTLFVDVSEAKVGIGTSSPDQALHLYQGALKIESGAPRIYLTDVNHDSDYSILNDNGLFGVYDDTNTSYRLRIDASGNVGIGTTSPANTLTVGNLTASANDQDATVGIKCNANHRGIILQENSGAEQWEIGVGEAGALKFYDSGSATPAVTFADDTGNVGIGTSSPSTKLDVSGDVSIRGTFPTLFFSDTNSDPDYYISAGNGYFQIYDNTNNTGRFYIDSSGNVGIGTNSPAAKLHVQSGGEAIRVNTANENTHISFGGARAKFGYARIGASDLTCIQGSTGKGIVFCTDNDTFGSGEKARIDLSGNLLVGRTSGSADNEDNGIVLSPTGFIYSAREGTGAGTHIAFINNTDATATTVGTIRSSGSTTSYNTSSDERLKENITDSADAGSKVDAIQIRQFDWKADGSHQDYGVIAQELINVAPEAVSEGDTEEDMMGVDYSKLVPMLIKEVQSLRSRVAELENV